MCGCMRVSIIISIVYIYELSTDCCGRRVATDNLVPDHDRKRHTNDVRSLLLYVEETVEAYSRQGLRAARTSIIAQAGLIELHHHHRAPSYVCNAN